MPLEPADVRGHLRDPRRVQRRQRGHVAEGPVMGTHAACDRKLEGGIRVVAGLVDPVDQGWPGFGAGAESRRPMGMAVVGGMLTSTFLTLLVIPVVYTMLSDLAEKFSRRQSPKPAPGPLGLQEATGK